MINPEALSLKLLTTSKNRLMAAQQDDWSKFSDFDFMWQALLESAVNSSPQALQSCRQELIQDNEEVIRLVKKTQNTLLTGLQKEVKGLESVKAYLK